MIPSRNSEEPTMLPPKSGVKVRMYNTGFGDCFLLAFRGRDNKGRYMLIDCGVHHQYKEIGTEKTGKDIMQLIAMDIDKATGNHIHVVVATHEHTDHLYGFKYAEDIFKEIKIDDLWLSWAEDPTDTLAKELKQIYGMRMRAFNAAVGKIEQVNSSFAAALKGVLGFEPLDALAATGVKKSQLEFLRYISKKKLEGHNDYRRPEEKPLSLPDVEGVKFYVLGPPRNVDWIKKLEKKSELYPELTGMNEEIAFSVAVLAADGTFEGDEKELYERSKPFDLDEKDPLYIPKDIASEHTDHKDFFQEYYFGPNQENQDIEWRRIENDWLTSAGQLSLKINSKTNNTSLVLAVELTETQPPKVLLFAADAQVGNWLSWEKLCWPGEGPDGETVKVSDLLRRTVLYKVGHHGSHNATLSEKGLEMMESPDLVAMIPVDEKWANEEMDWKHPAEKLLKRLKEKTRGRIIRTDDIPSGNKHPSQPRESTRREWTAFKNNLDWDRSGNQLWIEYKITE